MQSFDAANPICNSILHRVIGKLQFQVSCRFTEYVAVTGAFGAKHAHTSDVRMTTPNSCKEFV